jgi:hypothetical protein
VLVRAHRPYGLQGKLVVGALEIAVPVLAFQVWDGFGWAGQAVFTLKWLQ